jgi:hypothetical protein
MLDLYSPVILYCFILGKFRELILPHFGRSSHELGVFFKSAKRSVITPSQHSRYVAGVGCSEGKSVGVIVGFLVGEGVGFLVGCGVGAPVGTFVGVIVGLLVGEAVGV